MRQPWHRRHPALLEHVRADVEAFCPTLHIFVESETVSVRGTFPVLHESKVLDRYAIEIEFPSDYPDQLPIVREVGGRIPWNADNHVFPATGVCCVLLPEDRWWSFPGGQPFSQYLLGPLHNYFLGQSIFAVEGRWPFGAHEHGVDGVIAFYKEKFGTNEPKHVVVFLRAIGEGKIRGHRPCPCESGKIVRHCHAGIIDVAKVMPPHAARESFNRLVAALRAAQRPNAAASSEDRDA